MKIQMRIINKIRQRMRSTSMFVLTKSNQKLNIKTKITKNNKGNIAGAKNMLIKL